MPLLSRPRLGALLLAVLCVAAASVGAQDTVGARFAAFWAASTPADRELAAARIVASRVSVAAALGHLRAGREYSSDVPRGVSTHVRRAADGEYPYVLDVPEGYTSSRRYQLRVHLHGGVDRPVPAATPRGIGALAGDEQIYVLPAAWRDRPWWSAAQAENVLAIVDAVKRTYNIDENRVVLSGVSDGGTGAFYLAMRATTPFASFLPLNGFLMVLANASLGLRDGLFPQNLVAKPWFVVNGGRDPLYPAEMVTPYITHLQRAGVSIEYRPLPDGGHNTAWWPELAGAFEAFVRSHPRVPHPEQVSWETDGAPGTTRAHWLVIDELSRAPSSAALPDANDRVVGSGPNFGVRTSGMRVQAVLPGSNAAALGFHAGDVVTAVNGRALPDALDLLDFLGIFRPGEPLTFQVVRADTPGAATRTVELTGVYQPTNLPRTVPLFARNSASGRVDVSRRGNAITARTRGVKAFTVLLSPDAFDLSAPITITVDGDTRFSGRVEPRLDTLMKWAARDNDRTLLYAAELRVEL